MTRFSQYTTYRQYRTPGQYWLEVTVAEIFISTHCFKTAEELNANIEECCMTHESDIVPPCWIE